MVHFRFIPRLAAPLLAGLVCARVLAAGAAEDRVEVASVRFTTLRPPDGATDNWYEMTITLDARPAAGRPGRLTHRVRVEARLAYDVPATTGGARRWEFFRAAADLVGLTAGRTQVRFYLPPEIAQRDRLGGAPRYWEVTLAGTELAEANPLNRLAPALADETVHRAFLEKMAADGPANDGIFQPQFLTPFARVYPRSTPAFVRREAWP